ncbi:MAG: efflux RND transporter periplasmic adaptor subunit [Caulobacteraceae bacterium]|nr:efflux RND transporter periplasmic adaptor subunit [Caulobacteraceae bacterium]
MNDAAQAEAKTSEGADQATTKTANGAEQPGAKPPATRARPKARRSALIALAVVVVVGLGVWTLKATVFAQPSESTDDAYVGGDVVAITSREPGIIVALHADNTQSVRRGQPLLDLDASTADANLAAAEADLGRAVREVRSRFAQVDETQAQIVKSSVDLARAQDDLVRRQGAAKDGAVSGEEVDHAREAVRTATAAETLARSQHAEAEAAVQGTDIKSNPNVLAAIAAVRRAAIVRNHMHLTAPQDGVIAQRTVQLGQQVTPGAPLMAVVPLRRVWVDANFRETQLADLRVGQPVTLKSDAYGDHAVFHGKVLGLAPGSGNAFALLPPQNASGNWIKIVQRLPVRIGLDPSELDRHPLQIGLSVTARVDTRDRSGPFVARPAPTAPFESEANQDAGPEVEAQIARIIAQNSGRSSL